jgi:hypothetical protein
LCVEDDTLQAQYTGRETSNTLLYSKEAVIITHHVKVGQKTIFKILVKFLKKGIGIEIKESFKP